MIDVFTGLLLVALIGGGFLLARRLFERRNMMDPPVEMPWQSEYGPKDDYGRSVPPNRSYDGPGYGRPLYGPGYGDPRYSRPAYGPGYDPAGYGRPIVTPVSQDILKEIWREPHGRTRRDGRNLGDSCHPRGSSHQ